MREKFEFTIAMSTLRRGLYSSSYCSEWCNTTMNISNITIYITNIFILQKISHFKTVTKIKSKVLKNRNPPGLTLSFTKRPADSRDQLKTSDLVKTNINTPNKLTSIILNSTIVFTTTHSLFKRVVHIVLCIKCGSCILYIYKIHDPHSHCMLSITWNLNGVTSIFHLLKTPVIKLIHRDRVSVDLFPHVSGPVQGGEDNWEGERANQHVV